MKKICNSILAFLLVFSMILTLPGDVWAAGNQQNTVEEAGEELEVTEETAEKLVTDMFGEPLEEGTETGEEYQYKVSNDALSGIIDGIEDMHANETGEQEDNTLDEEEFSSANSEEEPQVENSGEETTEEVLSISSERSLMLPFALNLPIAFMAKEELFEKFFSRTLMDFCGAFAVRRDKVEVSTIKTALNIKNTNWMLGLFPQGTRDSSQKVERITKGFASFAKATKTGILPVAIIGTDQKPQWPFSPKLTVKIGKVIPYSDDIDDMMQQWCTSISTMTGKEYVLE